MSNPLSPDITTAIGTVCGRFHDVERAAIFGSRAKGTNALYSDVDIAVFGDIDFRVAERIASELDELPLIYTFDVLAYNSIKNPKLKDHINHVGVPVYERDA